MTTTRGDRGELTPDMMDILIHGWATPERVQRDVADYRDRGPCRIDGCGQPKVDGACPDHGTLHEDRGQWLWAQIAESGQK